MKDPDEIPLWWHFITAVAVACLVFIAGVITVVVTTPIYVLLEAIRKAKEYIND